MSQFYRIARSLEAVGAERSGRRTLRRWAEEHSEYPHIHLAALRRKVGPSVVIKTELGLGYRLRTD
jgi:hypothetical protein